jgi:hypothetical protein
MDWHRSCEEIRRKVKLTQSWQKEGSVPVKKRLYALFVILGFSVAILANAQRAHSALGGSVDSIEVDKKVLSAVQGAVASHTGYTVQEITSAANTVREYVSPSGVVFGIAWNGLVPPDLTQLLGSYAGEYQEALQKTPRQKGSRYLEVRTPGVIVEKWGHMRNLQGRAYAPALIPPGVSVDEIK